MLKRNKILLALFPLVLIGILTFLLTPLINKKGEDFSRVIMFKVGHAGFSFYPMGLMFEDVHVIYKKSGHTLATIKDVSYELISHLIWIDRLKLNVNQEFIEHLKEILVKRSESHGSLVPHEINGRFTDSEIVIEFFKGLENDKYFTLKKMHGSFKHFDPRNSKGLMDFRFGMNFTPEATFYTAGKVNPLDPLSRWIIEAEVKNVRLTYLNKILMNKIPVKFQEGSGNFYFEAIKDSNEIHGHFKPMFKGAKGKDSPEQMDLPFILRALSSVVRIVFDSGEEKFIGVKVPFRVNPNNLLDLDVNIGEAWNTFFTHAKDKKIKDGLDHQYQLK